MKKMRSYLQYVLVLGVLAMVAHSARKSILTEDEDCGLIFDSVDVVLPGGCRGTHATFSCTGRCKSKITPKIYYSK